MSRIPLLALVLAVAVPVSWATEEKRPAEKRPVLTYRDDRLTLNAEKTPLSAVLDELHRQSGAEIRGDVAGDAPITARFADVPLGEALERFLGKANFTLGYGDGGRLMSVTLLGGPLPPPEKTAAAEPSPDASASAAPQIPGEVRRSYETVWSFLLADKQYPVRGKLAEALGTNRVTMKDLAFAAARQPDPAVRGRALRAGIELVRSDAGVRQAFLDSIGTLDDEALAHIARQFAQQNAEEFVTRIGRGSDSGELRSRMSPILQHLGHMGPEK